MRLLYTRKYNYAHVQSIVYAVINRNGKKREKVYEPDYFYFGLKKSENIEVFSSFGVDI